MSAYLRTNHGEFTGDSLETIIRKEYGIRASKLNDAIVERSGGSFIVLARVIEFRADWMEESIMPGVNL